MSTHIEYAAESFRTTSRGGGLLAEDLERLRDYGESGGDRSRRGPRREPERDVVCVQASN
jgi:general stress protein YciG